MTEGDTGKVVCRSCRHIYSIEDSINTPVEYYGVYIMEKRCPVCGGFLVPAIPDESLDIYLYVNDDGRYYL